MHSIKNLLFLKYCVIKVLQIQSSCDNSKDLTTRFFVITQELNLDKF